jgi:two-component system, LuxR family, sensor kinase FixL
VLEVISAQVAGAIARIRAETALKESEMRLRTIINSAPLILFAGNRDGTLTFKEGQGLKAVGLQPGVRAGTPVAEAFAAHPQILQHLPRVLAGEEFSAIVELGLFAFACRYSPVLGKDGAVVGFIGVATNITEQQRLERQILEISDREQARIGQDIHDGLCQQLVSVAFDANSLERQLAAAQRPERGLAERIASFMDKAITEARQLSRGLFPIRLEGDGLALALEELSQTTRERFGVECTLVSDKRVREKDPVVATHLYRIAQEAINNALKHGHARHIQIRLIPSDAGLNLEVEDDGSGLNPESVSRSQGMGLHIMEYRARSIGGRFEVGSARLGGTRVSCCVLSPAT